MTRRLTFSLLLLLTLGLLTAAAVACGGSSGGGGCSPAFDDACVCTTGEGEVCDPNVDPGCFCALEENNAPSNNTPSNNDPNNNTSNNNSETNNNDNPTNNAPGTNNTPPPDPDNATLTFVATYGPGSRLQLPPGPRGYIPTFLGDGQLVVMLCATVDPTCEAPVWIGAPEQDAAPIQERFGPTITLGGLPAGDFLVMILEDSSASRARGQSWQDASLYGERAWGGAASTMDVLMSDQEPDVGFNPPPVPRAITLTADTTTDLGTIRLSHFHEHDISPEPEGERGLIVVASSSTGGLRLIDLETRDQLTAPEGGLDHTLVDADGAPIEGTICNIIPGPDATIWVLFGAAEGGGGYALRYDPVSRQQPTTHRVLFPGGNAQAGPCRATFAERGGQQYLFAVASGSGADQPRRGFWYANVTGLDAGDITAGQASSVDDLFWSSPQVGVEVHEDTLLLGSFAALPGCNDGLTQHSCVFQADFDPATGAPTLRRQGEAYDVLLANELLAPVPRAGLGETRCSSVAVPPAYFGMKVARFGKNNHDLLFVGNCLEINTFDLTDGGRQLDYDPDSPGVQGFDASFYGAGFYSFQTSPDGETLYAAPVNKSVYPFFVDAALEGEEPFIIDTDRHTLLALDLSDAVPGDLPAADPRSLGRDQDGYAGVPDYFADLYLPTEAVDPGIDLRAFYVRRTIYTWDRDLAGSVIYPVPNAPTLAAGERTLWVRGTGSESTGNSGLVWGSNLEVLDLAAQEMVLFPRGDAPFHQVFETLGEAKYGYDLTPEDEGELSTAGILYVPLPQ